jgi:hypothetical protein
MLVLLPYLTQLRNKLRGNFRTKNSLETLVLPFMFSFLLGRGRGEKEML